MAYKIIGITDEVTTCESCGKVNLKRTVALESDNGEVVYYGVDCASQAIFGKKSASNYKRIAQYGKVIGFVIEMANKAKEAGTYNGDYARKLSGYIFDKLGCFTNVKNGEIYVFFLGPREQAQKIVSNS